MKLVSDKALRELATLHPDARRPLQDFRHLVERGSFHGFAELRMTFGSVDKGDDRYVFDIGGNKYRLIATIAFQPQLMWVKAVLTHAQYDKEQWK